MTFDAYRPPGEGRDVRPAVIRWFRVYAGLMAMSALAVLALSSMRVPRSDVGLGPIATSVLMGGLAAFYAFAAFVPLRPWGWTVGLIAIGLGVAGCPALVAVPLLVFWMKPLTKAAFARL
jgi:hypothetical protein